MADKVIGVALLGLGTVGTGAYKIIQQQKEEMPQKLNATIEVRHILVRNLEKAAKKVEDPSVLTNDWNVILNDPEVDIVIEVMGGLEPAGTYITQALEKGISVVTANKDLIAERMDELVDLAQNHKADLLFEAAVAGGIPIIAPLKHSLSANFISEIMGIVNGSTNFILSKMTQERMGFKEALALATELGYAEADPTADIEGLDAGRKVAIMASLAFHAKVTFQDVYTEGITKLTQNEIAYADEFGYVIKLIGMARCNGRNVEARVHPMLIPKSHPLAAVSDSYNAVFVHGDAVDDVMFYGRGAGEMPTASAIMGDVFDIARDLVSGSEGTTRINAYKDRPVRPIEEDKSKFFVRMEVEDKPGVLAMVAGVFGCNGVSIRQMVQKEGSGDNAEIVIITDTVRERHLQDAFASLKTMSSVRTTPVMIRVY